jgi:hypothetical protein
MGEELTLKKRAVAGAGTRGGRVFGRSGKRRGRWGSGRAGRTIESWQRGFGGEAAEGRRFDGETVRSGGSVALDDREAGWMGDNGG